MPMYLLYQNGELKQIEEHENAYVADIQFERRYGKDYLLAVVVGKLHLDTIRRHLPLPVVQKRKK
jgi:hypothetical protein